MRWVSARQIAAELFTWRRWRGGYDPDQVDEFLDRVAADTADRDDHIGRLEDYIGELERERDQLRWRLQNVPRPGTYSGTGPVSGSAEPGPGHPEPVAAVPAAWLAQYAQLEEAALDVPRPPVHAAEKSGSHEAYAQGPGHPDTIGDEIEAGYQAWQAEIEAAKDVPAWRAREDRAHAEWCARNGLDYRPIEWTAA